MSDKKISQLTAATIPLAGTEVLPIVQSGSTVKVPVSDLTAGRSISAADITTTGNSLLAVSGGVVTVGTTNTSLGGLFAIRNDSGICASFNSLYTNGAAINFQNIGVDSFAIGMPANTGDLAFYQSGIGGAETARFTNGNLKFATSGKGIDFSATPGTGTSELLADYEEGTWTPTYTASSGAFGTITYGLQTGTYTKIGRLVSISCFLHTNSVTAGTAAGNLTITGLPYVPKSTQIYTGEVGFSSSFSGSVNPTDIVCSGSTVFMYYRATSAGNSGIFLANGATGLLTGANPAANYMIFSLVYEV